MCMKPCDTAAFMFPQTKRVGEVHAKANVYVSSHNPK